MATKGLVLIKLDTGREKEAIDMISKIEGVTSITGVFGGWDAVAVVDSKDLQTLAGLVVGRIRAVLGVAHTETLIEVKI